MELYNNDGQEADWEDLEEILGGKKKEKQLMKIPLAEASAMIERLSATNSRLKVKLKELGNRREDFQSVYIRTKQSTISLKDVQKLTYKALRKGQALDSLYRILDYNSCDFDLLRQRFEKLVHNAFGDKFLRNKPYFHRKLNCDTSHVLLFQREQAILLSENERLVAELNKIRKEFTKNSITEKRKDESETLIDNLLTKADHDESSEIDANEKSIATTEEQTSEEESQEEIIESPIKESDSDVVELDEEVVYRHLKSAVMLIEIAQLRLVSFAFRKLVDRLQLFRGIIWASGYKLKKKRRTRELAFMLHRTVIRRRTSVASAFWKFYVNMKKYDIRMPYACTSYGSDPVRYRKMLQRKNPHNLYISVSPGSSAHEYPRSFDEHPLMSEDSLEVQSKDPQRVMIRPSMTQLKTEQKYVMDVLSKSPATADNIKRSI